MFLDLENVKEQGGQIPEGVHLVRCEKAEVRTTKAGDGEYINCEFSVEGEPTKLYHMFNIKNKNVKAVQIGLGQLKSFLKASGYPNPNALNEVWELAGLTCLARIKHKTDDYGTKTQITYFKPISPTGSGQSKDTSVGLFSR